MIPGLCRMVFSQSHAQTQQRSPPLSEETVLGLTPWKCGATAVGPTWLYLLHAGWVHKALRITHPHFHHSP